VLNPLAKQKLTGELQEEISELQNSLDHAHREVYIVLQLLYKQTIRIYNTLPAQALSYRSKHCSMRCRPSKSM